MRKHSVNNPYKFMRGSHHSLSERQSLLFSFKEVRFKVCIATDNADGHKIDKSSEMTVASFRDSTCALKLAGLKDSRVNTSESNKGLMGREVVDISDLSEKSSTCSVSDTINGGDDFHFLNCNGLTELREDSIDFIKLLHKMKER